MFGLGAWEMLLIGVILVPLIIPVWAAWRIAGKAGFSPAWGLTVIIPVVNLIVLWVFAFSEWPTLASPVSPETAK